jgi:hypothetical protein
MLEALMASAILIVGLTGVTQLILEGSVSARNGEQYMSSASHASKFLQDMKAVGWEGLAATSGSLDAGGVDGGIMYDKDGRRYSVTYTVTNMAPTLGSSPWPTFLVQTEVSYRDGIGRTRLSRFNSIVTQAPDANY